MIEPSSEDGWIISVVELLAFIVLATIRGSDWKNELVFYVTDNSNVRSWLTKRRPRKKTASSPDH